MLRHWSPAISLLSLNECEAACPWALVLSDDSAPLSSYCNDRLSGFVCDSIWFLAGVTPALLQLTKESLCSYSPMIDPLSKAPQPNPQQRSILISRQGEPCGFLPQHTTPNHTTRHHAGLPTPACSLPSHAGCPFNRCCSLHCCAISQRRRTESGKRHRHSHFYLLKCFYGPC